MARITDLLGIDVSIEPPDPGGRGEAVAYHETVERRSGYGSAR
jgi:hypothetical protein